MRTARHAALALLFWGFGCATTGEAQAPPPASPAAEPTYQFDTPVTLSGLLATRKRWGPPGWGESPRSDARVTILVLRLPNAITVKPTADAEAKNSFSLETVRHVREIQLYVKDHAAGLKLARQRATVEGILNERIVGGDYTPVTMDVTRLTPK